MTLQYIFFFFLCVGGDQSPPRPPPKAIAPWRCHGTIAFGREGGELGGQKTHKTGKKDKAKILYAIDIETQENVLEWRKKKAKRRK